MSNLNPPRPDDSHLQHVTDIGNYQVAIWQRRSGSRACSIKLLPYVPGCMFMASIEFLEYSSCLEYSGNPDVVHIVSDETKRAMFTWARMKGYLK